MGYIVDAVQTGIEYAEKYHVQELLNKARTSSKSVDMTVTKLDTLLRAQGTPLVEKIDTQLDTGVAYGQRVVGGVREARAKTVEYAQEKLTVVTEPLQQQTALVKGKVESTRKYAAGKAEQVSTGAKAQLGRVPKAIEFAEMQLLVGAQKVDRVLKMNKASKAAAQAVKATNSAFAYGYKTAQAAAATTVAMPGAVKARVSTALVFLLAAKVQLFALPALVSAQKGLLQKSYAAGTLSKDAQKQYTLATGLVTKYAALAQEKATGYLPTSVAPYLEQAQQATAGLAAKAKAEMKKLSPFLARVQKVGAEQLARFHAKAE